VSNFSGALRQWPDGAGILSIYSYVAWLGYLNDDSFVWQIAGKHMEYQSPNKF
jgi:hypothetical protein